MRNETKGEALSAGANKQIGRELGATPAGRYKGGRDSTADNINPGEPISAGTRRNIEQPVFTGKGIIESDHRKGQLAGEGEQINRNKKRNNEHIKYEDEPENYTAGG